MVAGAVPAERLRLECDERGTAPKAPGPESLPVESERRRAAATVAAPAPARPLRPDSRRIRVGRGTTRRASAA